MEQYNNSSSNKSMEEPPLFVDDNDEKQKRLFVLGLIILSCWVIVIILCAYPQLFRDLLLRYVCCCFAGFAVRRHEKRRQRSEKLAKARERVRTASRSYISVSTAVSPPTIMLKEIGLSELRQSDTSMTIGARHQHYRTTQSEPIRGGGRETDTKIFLLDSGRGGGEENE